MPSKKKKYNARFPPARIKKIMQTDEDVGKVAAAVPVIISRALELFIESLILKANETTQARNAKTLSTAHIKQTILSEKKFDFLKDLVANIPDVQPNEEDGEGPSTPVEATLPKQRGRPRKRKAEDGEEPKRRRRRKESAQAKDDDSETEDADTDTANEEDAEDPDNETDSAEENENSVQSHEHDNQPSSSGSSSINSTAPHVTQMPGSYQFPQPPPHMAGHVPSMGLPHPLMVPHATPPNATPMVGAYGHQSSLERMGPPPGLNNFPHMAVPSYASGLPPANMYAPPYPSGLHTLASVSPNPSTSSSAASGKVTQQKTDDDDYDT